MRKRRLLLGGGRLLAIAGVLVLLAGIGVAVADPFAGHAAPHGSGLDNGSPTSTRRVERTSLAAQTQVSGTLGYAGTWTVSVPAGTGPEALRQAQQAVTAARSQLAAARAAVSADTQDVAQARAALTSAKTQKRTACTGSNSGSAGCSSARQAVTGAANALATAKQRRSADRSQLPGAEASLTSAEASLADAETSASSFGSTPTYTMLPASGHVVRRGRPLYGIDGQATLLLYGSTSAWRAFRSGMSSGADVAQLNANLRALGYAAPTGDTFTSATAAAISSLQQVDGLPQTGALLLGSVVFEPGALRVTTVTPTVGAAVQPGPVLTGTSTREDVTIPLDAAQQSEVKVGDRVSVVLPDNNATPGVVSAVGKVATVSSSDQQAAGGGSSSPTINVDVRLLHPSTASHLDQAPVEVSITAQSVSDVLAVPVNALVALAGGGYAVEEIEADGVHRLVAVRPGLFDDEQGLVQVSGGGVAAGQRVVVPAS